MGGNVREWAWNQSGGGRRWMLGGRLERPGMDAPVVPNASAASRSTGRRPTASGAHGMVAVCQARPDRIVARVIVTRDVTANGQSGIGRGFRGVQTAIRARVPSRARRSTTHVWDGTRHELAGLDQGNALLPFGRGRRGRAGIGPPCSSASQDASPHTSSLCTSRVSPFGRALVERAICRLRTGGLSWSGSGRAPFICPVYKG